MSKTRALRVMKAPKTFCLRVTTLARIESYAENKSIHPTDVVERAIDFFFAEVTCPACNAKYARCLEACPGCKRQAAAAEPQQPMEVLA